MRGMEWWAPMDWALPSCPGELPGGGPLGGASPSSAISSRLSPTPCSPPLKCSAPSVSTLYTGMNLHARIGRTLRPPEHATNMDLRCCSRQAPYVLHGTCLSLRLLWEASGGILHGLTNSSWQLVAGRIGVHMSEALFWRQL